MFLSVAVQGEGAEKVPEILGHEDTQPGRVGEQLRHIYPVFDLEKKKVNVAFFVDPVERLRDFAFFNDLQRAYGNRTDDAALDITMELLPVMTYASDKQIKSLLREVGFSPLEVNNPDAQVKIQKFFVDHTYDYSWCSKKRRVIGLTVTCKRPLMDAILALTKAAIEIRRTPPEDAERVKKVEFDLARQLASVSNAGGPIPDRPDRIEDPISSARWLFKHGKQGAKLVAHTKMAGTPGTWFCRFHDDRWDVTCWTPEGFPMFTPEFLKDFNQRMQVPLTKLRERLGKNQKLIVLDSTVMPWNYRPESPVEPRVLAPTAEHHVCLFAIARAMRLAGTYQKKYEDALAQIDLIQAAISRTCWPVTKFYDLKVSFTDVLYPASDTDRAWDTLQTLRECFDSTVFTKQPEFIIFQDDKRGFEVLEKWFTDTVKAGPAQEITIQYDVRSETSASTYPQRAFDVRGWDALRFAYGPYVIAKTPAIRPTFDSEYEMHNAYNRGTVRSDALSRLREIAPSIVEHGVSQESVSRT